MSISSSSDALFSTFLMSLYDSVMKSKAAFFVNGIFFIFFLASPGILFELHIEPMKVSFTVVLRRTAGL